MVTAKHDEIIETANFLEIDISEPSNYAFVAWLNEEDEVNHILQDSYPASLKKSWDAALAYISKESAKG